MFDAVDRGGDVGMGCAPARGDGGVLCKLGSREGGVALGKLCSGECYRPIGGGPARFVAVSRNGGGAVPGLRN